MGAKLPPTSATGKGADVMTYFERLANYEREKMQIPRMANDYKTYEAMLKALAEKWRI